MKRIDPILVKDYLNQKRDANEASFKEWLFFHVEADDFFMNHETIQTLAVPDVDLKTGTIRGYKNPRVGGFGILNGLVGIHDGDHRLDANGEVEIYDKENGSGWAYVSAEVDEEGQHHRFVFTPNALIHEREPEEGEPPFNRPEPPTSIAPDFALNYLNDIMANSPDALKTILTKKFDSKDNTLGEKGKFTTLDLINGVVDIGKTDPWGKIVFDGKTFSVKKK